MAVLVDVKLGLHRSLLLLLWLQGLSLILHHTCEVCESTKCPAYSTEACRSLKHNKIVFANGTKGPFISQFKCPAKCKLVQHDCHASSYSEQAHTGLLHPDYNTKAAKCMFAFKADTMCAL